MRNITVYIPGLFGPKAHYSEEYIPKIESLEWLLGRGHHERLIQASYYETIADLLEYETNVDKDIPVAAITRLIDGEEHPDGVWMRADPIHLAPDRDGLVLVDSSAFQLSQHDALALAADVQQVLDETGWQLEVPFPTRWYLHLDTMPEIKTYDIDIVAGKDINKYLPEEKSGAQLHQLLNEIQMQLHRNDINQQREQNGILPVNSLWFWGIGELPDALHRQWTAVYSDDVFVKGLAMISTTPCENVPNDLWKLLQDCNEDAEILLVLDECLVPVRYEDSENWNDKLANMTHYWFEPLREALQKKEIDHLELITDQHTFELNSFSSKKFWRRPAPFKTFTNG